MTKKLTKSEKLDIAIDAALNGVLPYLVGQSNKRGFNFTRKDWYFYVKITSYTIDISPLVGISTKSISVKLTPISDWEVLYDYENETDKEIIYENVKQHIEKAFKYAIFH